MVRKTSNNGLPFNNVFQALSRKQALAAQILSSKLHLRRKTTKTILIFEQGSLRTIGYGNYCYRGYSTNESHFHGISNCIDKMVVVSVAVDVEDINAKHADVFRKSRLEC